MEQDVDELIKEYAAVEAVAEDILSDKQQIVDLDSRWNKGREALRQLRNHHPNVKSGETKLWVCFGNTFIKMDAAACTTMLMKDQETLAGEIDQLHSGLKPKVAQLHKMEGRAESKGFQLKGMRIEELLHTQSHSQQATTPE